MGLRGPQKKEGPRNIECLAITFRLHTQLNERLQVMAAVAGMSRSEFVRELVKKALAEEPGGRPSSADLQTDV